MCEQRQVDVHERVRTGEALPGGRAATVPINDPRVTLQQLRVRLQIVLVRNLGAAGSVLDHVQRVERNVGQRGQPLG